LDLLAAARPARFGEEKKRKRFGAGYVPLTRRTPDGAQKKGKRKRFGKRGRTVVCREYPI
jgi:hypothetical protein